MTFSPTSITVDRTSPVPMYYQVAQQLEEAIESGELPAGSRLHGELALAQALGGSPPTLRRAREAPAAPRCSTPRGGRRGALPSLYDDLVPRRKNPRTEVLSIGRVPAS